LRLYLDANAIIYSVEGLPGFQAGVSRWVRQVEAAAGLLITSRLSMLECRVGPLRQGDQSTLARYEAFFSGDNLAVFDVGSDVIDRATDLRVRYGFRSPDAIHLATAILVEADVFLTGDVRLERCTEISVVLLTAEPTA
jgi:predicted nucleic acid-binding protein